VQAPFVPFTTVAVQAAAKFGHKARPQVPIVAECVRFTIFDAMNEFFFITTLLSCGLIDVVRAWLALLHVQASHHALVKGEFQVVAEQVVHHHIGGADEATGDSERLDHRVAHPQVLAIFVALLQGDIDVAKVRSGRIML